MLAGKLFRVRLECRAEEPGNAESKPTERRNVPTRSLNPHPLQKRKTQGMRHPREFQLWWDLDAAAARKARATGPNRTSRWVTKFKFLTTEFLVGWSGGW